MASADFQAEASAVTAAVRSAEEDFPAEAVHSAEAVPAEGFNTFLTEQF